MTAIAFDTLKFAKRLKEGGFTEQQAQALATAEAELIEDNLATRRHLKELEAAVQRDIKELEAALRRDIKAGFVLHHSLECRWCLFIDDFCYKICRVSSIKFCKFSKRP